MPVAYRLPEFSPETTKNLASLLRLVIIILIAGAAISSRLFAVVRHESIIHEFDPWCEYSEDDVDGTLEIYNDLHLSARHSRDSVMRGRIG